MDLTGSILGTGNTSVTARTRGKPQSGESSGPQNTASGMPFAFGGMFATAYGMAGGGALGPGGGVLGGWGGMFPGGYAGLSLAFGGALYGFGSNGFIQPRKGSYATYRLMSTHPVIRLVKQLIVGPILSSQWTIKPSDWAAQQQKGATRRKPRAGASGLRPKLDPIRLENAIELVKEQILPLRSGYLNESLRYLESGWRGFELVFDIRRSGPNGPMFWLRKIKPLLPELTQILHDGKGNFAGLTQLSGDQGMRSDKTFIVTYDGEAGNLYGYSRHEAAYDPWVDWQSARIRRWLTGNKIAGYLAILYYRPGTTPINGTQTDNGAIAKQILAAIGVGNGTAVPTTEYTDEELQQNPELAKLAPWKLEIVDAGSYAPAVAGMIGESEYCDKNIVRAWGWPERAVLEAQRSGSRADSKTHSDNSSSDRELIDDDLATQLTRGQPSYEVPGVVQDILSLNFGDDYRDAVEVQPAPLVDEKVQVYEQLLAAALGDQTIGPAIASKVDWDELADHLDIETTDSINDYLKSVGAPMQVDPNTHKPAPVVDPKQAPASKKGQRQQRTEAARVLSRWLGGTKKKRK